MSIRPAGSGPVRLQLVALLSAALLCFSVGCDDSEPAPADDPPAAGDSETDTDVDPDAAPVTEPPPQDDPTADPDEDATSATAAVQSMLSLLRAGQYEVFITQFKPQGTQATSDEQIRNLQEKPEAVERLIEMLELAKDAEPQPGTTPDRVILYFPDGTVEPGEPIGISLLKDGDSWGSFEPVMAVPAPAQPDSLPES